MLFLERGLSAGSDGATVALDEGSRQPPAREDYSFLASVAQGLVAAS